MSIDWLFDLERDIDNGKMIYGCPGISRNQWVIAKSTDELKKVAKRTADHKKIAVNIYRVISKLDTVVGDMFLVPTGIGDPGARGEPNIQWSQVETREAAEMMRDVKHGPSPFFGIQVDSEVQPDERA